MPVRILLSALVVLMSACGSKKNNPQPAPTNPNLPPPIDVTGGGSYLPPGNQPYPPAVAPAAPVQQGQYIDPRVALNGMGRWIQIDGQIFFIPDLSGQNGGWEPYQNGYWSYDQDRDWTWNSSDRWGSVTDHYGVWRNHRTHGWIWAPFDLRLEKRHYQPHCVTWFDEGEYVGWYPYFTGFEAHYRRFGRNQGFVDGYWDGHRSVLALNGNAFGFRLGITLVSRTDITQPNIRRRMIRDRNIILRIAHSSHRQDRIRSGRVGRVPGGDRRRSYEFLQRWAPHQKAPVRGERRRWSKRGS